MLRKGRLIAKYEFKELKKNKAQNLSDSLGNKNMIECDLTLADIFNQDEKPCQNECIEKIGFRVAEKELV